MAVAACPEARTCASRCPARATSSASRWRRLYLSWDVFFLEKRGLSESSALRRACSPPRRCRRWPTRTAARRSEPLAPCSGGKNGSRASLSSSLCGLCMAGRYAACAWACGGWQAATRGLWRAARRPVSGPLRGQRAHIAASDKSLSLQLGTAAVPRASRPWFAPPLSQESASHIAQPERARGR